MTDEAPNALKEEGALSADFLGKKALQQGWLSWLVSLRPRIAIAVGALSAALSVRLSIMRVTAIAAIAAAALQEVDACAWALTTDRLAERYVHLIRGWVAAADRRQ